MTFDPSVPVLALQAVLVASSVFPGGVLIGEPFSPPVGLTAAIFFMDVDPAQTTLGSTIDVWTLQVRIYARAGMTPVDASKVEISVAQGVQTVLSALAGGFTLSGSMRAIDWAGEEAGRKLSVKWGHLVVSGTIFRMVDITVPLIVDDAATFAA